MTKPDERSDCIRVKQGLTEATINLVAAENALRLAAISDPPNPGFSQAKQALGGARSDYDVALEELQSHQGTHN